MKKGGHVRRRYYEEMVRDEGEFCKVCGRKPPGTYLEIDHKDGDVKNNARPNRQLLCRRDNRIKNPRGKGKGMKLQRLRDLEEPIVSSAEFKKNKECEPIFRHYLYDLIKRTGQQPVKEIINAGAEKAGCSQAAVKRYLAKCCSIEGLYIAFFDEIAEENLVRFREGITIGISADLLGDEQ